MIGTCAEEAHATSEGPSSFSHSFVFPSLLDLVFLEIKPEIFFMYIIEVIMAYGFFVIKIRLKFPVERFLLPSQRIDRVWIQCSQ